VLLTDQEGLDCIARLPASWTENRPSHHQNYIPLGVMRVHCLFRRTSAATTHAAHSDDEDGDGEARTGDDLWQEERLKVRCGKWAAFLGLGFGA
jgi:hypothetical protein